MKHHGGRPSKCNHAVMEELSRLLESGATVQEAARKVGVSKVAIYAWIKKGRHQQSGVYREFLNRVLTNSQRPIRLRFKKAKLAMYGACDETFKAAVFYDEVARFIRLARIPFDVAQMGLSMLQDELDDDAFRDSPTWVENIEARKDTSN